VRFSGQIKQAKNAIEVARAKEEFASRAILPSALSSLNVYVVRVIEQLVALPLTRDETLVATELPMQDVEAIRTCIRYAEATQAKQIAEILKLFPFAFSLPAKIRHWVEAVSEGPRPRYWLQHRRRMVAGRFGRRRAGITPALRREQYIALRRS
jgi:hypothetical protein